MSMPIQRQSESYGIFDDGPRFARDRASTDLPRGLAGLVNTTGLRISAGLLNTRTAAPAASVGEGGADMASIFFQPMEMTTGTASTSLPGAAAKLIWNGSTMTGQETTPAFNPGPRAASRWHADFDPTARPRIHRAGQECEYCGKPGHDWTRHPEAHADVAEWERERHRQEFPFGDYRGDYHEGRRVAVNTDGMDPASHAYGRQPYDPLFGEFGHDGYDYEGVSRAEYRHRTRDYDAEAASQEAREEEDDESGYNWGPEPTGVPELLVRNRDARRHAGYADEEADDEVPSSHRDRWRRQRENDIRLTREILPDPPARTPRTLREMMGREGRTAGNWEQTPDYPEYMRQRGLTPRTVE